MLLRRAAQPTIRKLSDPITPVRYRIPFSDPASGPASPLERNPQSPRGWKNRESDGVGLAIVAALERSDGPKSIKHISAPISICSYGRESERKWRSRGGENRNGGAGFFCGSPPPADVFRTADFLNYCHLCRKRLHGKDIYMYRGEKAFCSVECRCQQIASDEFHEKCGAEALRAADVSASPYADDRRLFFTGIAVA